jgi:hypothetical protein
LAKHKIGRNAPCPCGSGKKYKHCCGPLAEITSISIDPFIRYNDIMTALKLKLDHANRDYIRKQRRSLQSRFIRFATEQYLPPEHETLFSDWLWFDVEGESGCSIGELYLQENGPYLDTASRNCLEALSRSRLGIYEAIGSSYMHLLVRDLATGLEQAVLLKEPLEFDNSATILLLGRLAQLPEDNMFSGMVLMVEDKALEKAFLTEHIQYLLNLYDDDAEKVFKQNGEVVYGLFNHAQNKTVFKLNDIRMLYHHTTQEEAVQRILAAFSGYRLLHASQGWSWLATGDGSGTYARLAIGPEIILSCADLLDEVDSQAKHLSQLWPGEPQQLVSSVLYPYPPAAEMVPLWLMVIKDKETERWLDMSHSEEGLTFRQLLAEEGGKESLEAILTRFESTRDSEEEKELAAYIRERLSTATQ